MIEIGERCRYSARQRQYINIKVLRQPARQALSCCVVPEMRGELGSHIRGGWPLKAEGALASEVCQTFRRGGTETSAATTTMPPIGVFAIYTCALAALNLWQSPRKPAE
jgi:hypothetical protein